MDSMINPYTADRKIRSDEPYTPGGGIEASRAASSTTTTGRGRCAAASWPAS